MRCGFLDESGGADPFSGSHFLVVAILCADNPRPLELHVKRARKSLGRKAHADELKATMLTAPIVERLLHSIAEEDVEIVVVVVDKGAILRPPNDPEEIYRKAVTRAVFHCVDRWPRIDLVLDKRYTKRSLRHDLERAIREEIAEMDQEVVLARQLDSRTQKELQAADHVAWAIFQKYETGEDRFYAIISDKIVVEEMIKQHLW
jgi:hypothetical protein